MKRMLVVIAVIVCAGMASANLIPNGDFDGNADGWSMWGNSTGYNSTSDAAYVGWGNGNSIWRSAGIVFEADTVYTMSAIVSSPDNGSGGGNQYEGVKLSLSKIVEGTWTRVAEQDFMFPPEDRLAGRPGNFREFTFTFDTGFNPDVVGKNVGVGVAAIDNADWGPNGWLYIQSVSLVPEPATVLLLATGSLAALKRRKQTFFKKFNS